MPASLRLFTLLLCLWAGYLQAATYAYRNDVFSYDTPSANAITVGWHATGASPACTSYPLGDDDWADIVFANATTPVNNFTFTFAGTAYTQARIYSNGMIVFGTDNSGFWRQFSNSNLPITSAAPAYSGCNSGVPANLIIPYWTDIVAGTGNSTTGASIQYEILGTAPNRRLVISWVNVKLYNQTTRYNFQVALYESPVGGQNSNFKYQYTNGSSTGSAATVGVQVSTTDYTLYSYNSAFIDPTAGSAILWYPANQLSAKGAEYRFDESSWNGTPGEVKDTSGNGQNAVRVGAATNVSNGKICRGGSFTANTSNATIDGVSTPITPINAGSFDFWYNANAKWNTADAMLLDASLTTSAPFFFEKTAAGALKISVTDSSGTVLTLTSANQTFAAGTWHHVGASWNMRPGSNQTLLQIFLDGTLLTSLRTTSTGSTAALAKMLIGDNATANITPNGGTGNGANGLIDEVNIYPTEINVSQAAADMNATRTTCTSVDHFHVIHNGTAVTCDIAPVTIQAHDSNHALISLSGVTLALSTSTAHGNWSNISGGSINTINNLGNGSATYVFSNESSMIFGLQDTTAESLTISATSGTVTTTSGSATPCTASDYTFGTTCNAPLSFVQAGFRVVDSNGNPVTPQTAGVMSGTYYLQAIKAGTTTSACTSLFPANTPVTLNLGFECNNPLTCKTGTFNFVPGTGAGTAGNIASNANGAITATTGNYTAKALTFNAASPLPAVPFTFSYSDVGQIRLWASYTPSGGSNISGNAQFVVAPASFAFSTLPSSPIKAGQPFNVTVTAMNGASSPVATPNFGLETTPETFNLTYQKCQPTGTGASNGNFTAGSLGTVLNGATIVSNSNWSEVGNIDLTATLASGSYLGSGKTVTGNTGKTGVCTNAGAGNIGTFVPDHFLAVVTQGCTAGVTKFTYSGQPFIFQVTAMNGLATPTTTVNYDGSANTSPNFANNASLSETTGAAGTLSGSVPKAAFVQGVANLNTAATEPFFTFTTPLTAPTQITVRASGDASSSGYEQNSTTLIRSGRLKLSNAFGSEKSTLLVPIQTQFWSASWITNTSDSCSVIPTNAVALSNYTGTLSATSFGATPVSCASGYCSSSNIKVTNGQSYLQLPPPSPTTGSVSLAIDLGNSGVDQSCLASHGGTGAALPWLRGMFGTCTAASSYTADPSATASFGIYTPETRKAVHVRELF